MRRPGPTSERAAEPASRSQLATTRRWATDAAASDSRWTVHVAVPGHEAELRAELVHRGQRVEATVPRRGGELVVVPQGASEAHWAANTWHDAQVVAIESIGDARRALLDRQRNWAPASVTGRERLVSEQLPALRRTPLQLDERAPQGHLGAWALLDSDLLLAADRTSRPFPQGQPALAETDEPPSRAYRKLWEAALLLDRLGQPGETATDFGAFPGGWSWLLAAWGVEVHALDRVAVEPRAWRVRARVSVGVGNGLTAPVRGDEEWIVSDMACEPRKLLPTFTRWLEAKAHVVATLKFHGPADPGLVRGFAELPGVRVVHLHNNGHELTAMRANPDTALS